MTAYVRRLARSLLLAVLPLVGPVGAAAAGAQSVDLVVAATTDVHGRIRGWDYYANAADTRRSLAGAATIVDSLRSAHPDRVVLVDGGDLLQGNPLTYVAAKVSNPVVHPVIAAMNVMRYDAAVLGNHEFNYGVPALRAAIERAAFPFLAANVKEASGADFVAPMTMVERRGIRVAIVGGTTPGSMVWDRDNLRQARLTVSDIVPAVRRAVADARRRRADVVVVLVHSGLDEAATYDTVATGLPSENVAARIPREIDGVDLVVLGHSHRELVDTTINGALVVQPRNWAASVAVAKLTLEKSRGRWRVIARRGQSVRVEGHRESREVLAASEGTHRATIAWATAPAGRTAVAWRSDSARVTDQPITDLVNEIMRRESGADLSATAVFSLDAALDSGAITRAMLSSVYPYDNTLRAVRISGAQLRAFLEFSSRYYRTLAPDGSAPSGGLIDPAIPGYNFDVVSGADYTIDLTKPIGSRITMLTIGGRAVADSDSLTLALNNYRQSGGGGYAMLAGAPVVYEKEVDIRQLLIDEVQRTPVLDPSRYATRNWTLQPTAAVALAFAEQRRGRGAESGGGAPVRDVAIPTATTDASTRRPDLPRVRVIAMSDFHAALRARPDGNGRLVGGAVALSAAIARAQRECADRCQSVVVDAGDLFTGTPASDWDAGRPTVQLLNRLQVAAGALGNHEFDFGQDTLRMRAKELQHALLGVNVRDANGWMPDFLRADTVVVRGGIRIGIVGAAGEHTPSTTKFRNVRGLTFLDPAPLISERVRSLRAEGAQVVVAVIHDGARCTRDTPAKCTGGGLDVANRLTDRPDVFVLGHAHENLDVRVGLMPVIEPTSNGRAIAVIDIPLDGSAPWSELRPVFGDSLQGADPAVDSIATAAVARVQVRLQQPVATIATPLLRRGNQYALGNLLVDAARTASESDFGIWNNGGIRADIVAGVLTYGGVHEVTPFGNVLVRMRMSGRQVARFAERLVLGGRAQGHISGMTVEFDSTAGAADGARVRRILTSAGRPLEPEGVYTLVINDFMLDEPASAIYTTFQSVDVLPVRDIDAFSDYLMKLPQPVRAADEARIRAVAPTSAPGARP